MEIITLKPLLHNSKEYIGLYFKRNAGIDHIIKKQKGVQWSQTHRCWYLPLSESVYETFKKDMKDKAGIENTALREYLKKKKLLEKQNPALANGNIATAIEPAKGTALKSVPAKPSQVKVLQTVSVGNLAQLETFTEMLTLKAYSPSTIKTYRNEFLQLLQVLKSKPAESLTVREIKRYMVFALKEQHISENTAHSRTNSMKFYYEQVLGRAKFFCDIPRPKKQDLLPKVFSQQDVAAIINAVKNLKHKVMLMLAYSVGLRVSEVVSLKTFQIDSKRMTIFISQSKGKKDRMVILSPVLLVMLREYALQYKPGKEGFLFSGFLKNAAYSSRSLQEIIQHAKKKAGIIQPGSIHSLRHSFATHLVERGTDISMIQKLLGHNDIRTTLKYLHTSNKDLIKIISPLDDLDLK